MRQYGVIYADPPWLFRTYSAKGTGRGAISHYHVMTFDEIKALPVGEWTLPDCALFLWLPGPHLLQGLQLMNAWGFTYKGSGFVWIKPVKSVAKLLADRRAGRPLIAGKIGKIDFSIGTGYGTRKNAEFCLLGTRGSPHRLSKGVEELIVEPRRQHSQKPDCARDRIMRLFPGPYLELFARSTVPGWDAQGDQVGLLDRGPVKTRRQPSSLVAERF
jgi:N6-adenosine-specific RNA methylase IME4